MKSVRLLLGIACGVASLALFSGCETQQSACEREKRLTERLDEMQMELDGRLQGVNMEMASMRTNPPVVVQQVPTPMPVPDYNALTNPSSTTPAMSVDTISIEDDYYASSKREQLEQLAASSRRQQIYDEPPPRAQAGSSNQSNVAKHIRVPVPVRTVQAALKEAGHLNGNVDGKVGRQTIAAITSFQRSQGIKADGIVGRQTWQLLYPYVPAGMSTTRLK
ncbi:MAG: peptidoglycan-binding protein [Planctomycetaceae bacterium]|nr:peptidoglycan-binding protein [Planctomycetaceae bacterium]